MIGACPQAPADSMTAYMKKTARKRQTTTVSTDQINQLAIDHHLAGRLAEAGELYQKALAIDPNDFDALHLSGLLAYQSGDSAKAVDLIARALSRQPSNPFALNNLGNALAALGHAAEAISSYRSALTYKPDYPDALNNLGGSLQAQGMLDEAIDCYHRALALRADYTDARHNLGNALLAKGQLDEAAGCYRAVLAIDPGYADAYYKLGFVLASQGQLEDAISLYQKAISLKPNDGEFHFQLAYILTEQEKLHEAANTFRRAIELRPKHAISHYNLGRVLYKLGQLRDALVCFQSALALQPDLAEAYFNLGITLNDLRELDLAVTCYRKAIALRPAYAEAYNNMGNSLKWQGKLDDSLDCYKKALALNDSPSVHSNVLQTMMYSAACRPPDLFAELRRFAERYEAPLIAQWRPHGNRKDGDRRLKVGYVSGDFLNHSIAFFIEPVLANHDRSQFEVFCYYNHSEHDDYTRRIISVADHFLTCHAMSDDELAERIRQDEIDVLIDLSGHSGRHRLLTFARKPAPVQITWMGTPGSTGLAAMDYKLTNEHMDPPGMTERFHTESLIRLPASAAYHPPESSPPVNELPALTSGYFTLACLNNPVKISQDVVAVWARILAALPNARIILGNADGAGMRDHLSGMFAREGIGSERLVMQPQIPLASYMQLHHHIDLALDPFPYNGGTTTRHALWMGVPVVTMTGENSMSRVGSAIMTRAGLPEFIVDNADDYVSRVVELAHDLPRLSRIRGSLRSQLSSDNRNSDEQFTRALEREFRTAWRKWCASCSSSQESSSSNAPREELA